MSVKAERVDRAARTVEQFGAQSCLRKSAETFESSANTSLDAADTACLCQVTAHEAVCLTYANRCSEALFS